jgi:putative nucleotidyltransferase-like protein
LTWNRADVGDTSSGKARCYRPARRGGQEGSNRIPTCSAVCAAAKATRIVLARMNARARPLRGGCWPTDDQILLLRAALFDADEARAAWADWRSTESPDTAEHASQRLLPLAYRNLVAAGVPDSDLAVLKSAYRAAWLRNQLLLEGAAAALRALHDAGIRTMVLKGVPLALLHYRDTGVRPMLDVDILVRRADAERARSALTASGWTESYPAPNGRRGGAHALALDDGLGRSLDLHWSALAESAPDDDFWSASVELDVFGVSTRALCPADQLLHAAVHGGQWNPVPPVRWMADAVAIQRSGGADVDWERMVSEATRRRVTVLLEASLLHLADAVRFPVPAWVLERLRRAPKGRLERWAHRAATRPLGTGGWLPVILDRYGRMSRLDPSLRLTDFLKQHFGVRTHRELAGSLARKNAQVAVGQLALRLAPARVPTCSRCGRRVVDLGRSGAPLCEHCLETA